jgi:hypothetical protein
MNQTLLALQNLARYKVVTALLLCLLVGLSPALASESTVSPSATDYNAQVATAWFDLQLKLVRETPGFSPPVASRAFGYTGVTLYEAIVPGMPDYQSLAGQLNELTKLPRPVEGITYHWATVANSALATITGYLFPTASDENLAAIDTLYSRFSDKFADEVNEYIFSRSVTQGRVVADAIYIWSLTDGGHEGYIRNFPQDFVPPTGEGLWVPTPRTGGEPQAALQPYWGNNRSFVLNFDEECQSPPHPDYSEDRQSIFYREVLEVYETAQNLTPEEIEIALFWADDPGQTSTPPGHSISILTQILRQEDASLSFAAEAYARMGIAVADAFIGCWQAKYIYNLVRPVTYIQQWMDGDWMPIVNTPPFPEYPSGHSVQSGAASVVFSGLFGENYSFTDHTHDRLDMARRSFVSFTQMAEEAAISRLYGGIHYHFAIELGLEQGWCIGEQVNALRLRR